MEIVHKEKLEMSTIQMSTILRISFNISDIKKKPECWTLLCHNQQGTHLGGNSHIVGHSLEQWPLAFIVMQRCGMKRRYEAAEIMNLALEYVATSIKLDWLHYLHPHLFLLHCLMIEPLWRMFAFITPWCLSLRWVQVLITLLWMVMDHAHFE